MSFTSWGCFPIPTSNIIHPFLFKCALPICAIPNGNELDVESTTFLKLVNICCAVSGLKYA